MPFWRAFSRPVTAALPLDPLYMRRLTYKVANSMHRCLPAWRWTAVGRHESVDSGCVRQRLYPAISGR